MPDTPFDPEMPATAAGLPLRLAVRFGVGAGLVCAAWMVGLQVTGNNGFGPKLLLAQLLVPLAAVGSEWQLRRQLRPARPGLGRSLGVGGLTVLLAAVVSAGSLAGLALGVGEPALARHRTEMLEIRRTHQQGITQVKPMAGAQQAEMQWVASLTAADFAAINFRQVLLLGLVLAVPAGIFLRE